MKETFGIFFKKKDQEPNLQTKLSKLGLDIHADEKLTDRIKLINALHDEIETSIEADDPITILKVHRDHMQAINRGMKVISIPYGRAGDQTLYREAMRGWEMLYAIGMDIIVTVQSMVADLTIKESSNTNQGKSQFGLFKMNTGDLIRKLEGFLQIEIYPYAFLIMDSSYYGKDVAASYATVVQSFSQKPREDMTSEPNF